MKWAEHILRSIKALARKSTRKFDLFFVRRRLLGENPALFTDEGKLALVDLGSLGFPLFHAFHCDML